MVEHIRNGRHRQGGSRVVSRSRGEDIRPRRITAVPRLSIGLPVYNGERHLAESIESLLGQTYENFELIVSDNASTDGTSEICLRYRDRTTVSATSGKSTTSASSRITPFSSRRPGESCSRAQRTTISTPATCWLGALKPSMNIRTLFWRTPGRRWSTVPAAWSARSVPVRRSTHLEWLTGSGTSSTRAVTTTSMRSSAPRHCDASSTRGVITSPIGCSTSNSH